MALRRHLVGYQVEIDPIAARRCPIVAEDKTVLLRDALIHPIKLEGATVVGSVRLGWIG